MGRVASAGDNAAMESFFALLHKSVLNRQSWQTRDELRGANTYRSNAPITENGDNDPLTNSRRSSLR